MRKLRKLVLMTAALAALAVGGAAFAQAQNAGTVAKVTVQQPKGETSAPGDTDGAQSGDQSESEQGGQTGEQESGEESQMEAPDSASESDGPDGHHDESGSAAAHESEGD
ncbi:MAG TPA: hypothetical protein VIM28_10330 [Solirubrobacterales bacterium]